MAEKPNSYFAKAAKLWYGIVDVDQSDDILIKITKLLNRIAEVGIVSLMLLVVGNVILRLFKLPIKGTYEFVGFLTVIIISFSIAYCAVRNGHIAVNYLMDKLPKQVQKLIDIIIIAISAVFMAAVSWNVAQHALLLKAQNETSMTTLTPIYPFILIIAIGVFLLCLVLLAKLIATIRRKDVILK